MRSGLVVPCETRSRRGVLGDACKVEDRNAANVANLVVEQGTTSPDLMRTDGR